MFANLVTLVLKDKASEGVFPMDLTIDVPKTTRE